MDGWQFPSVRFERYVDDAVIHCVSERQARQVLAALQDRMGEVGLRLHPDKTRIVYCKDGKRRGDYQHTAFTFLGFTFRPRAARAKERDHVRLVYAPISKDALNKIGREVRSWRLHHRTRQSFSELARWVNPIARGWMQYYGAFYRSALYPLLTRINAYLMRWVRKKYRRFQGRREFQRAWQRVTTQYRGSSPTGNGRPASPPSGDQGDKSRMNREIHVRFRGSRRVRPPPATRPLSLRDVEELMVARGVVVTYETIRSWCAKFGPDYAAQLRRRAPPPRRQSGTSTRFS